MIEDLINLLLGRKQKRCPHGATSWYICPKCKEEHPEWAPFYGEGEYQPYVY